MTKKPHGPAPIVAAALDLAAERGWRRLSLADIAERAGMKLPQVVEHFPGKTEILDAYARQVDHHMLEAGGVAGETARDRLFEVVMRRFEAMAPHRRALAVILRETGDDPWALLCGGRRFVKSMALTLETAGLASSGLGGLALVEGLTVVYLYALRAFLDDETGDLSRTMAALDKALRRAEGLAVLLCRRQGAARPAPVGGTAG